jgi:hypothetical protein
MKVNSQPIHQEGEMSDQLKHLVKKLRFQLSQVLGSLMSVLVNNSGCLGHPAANSPRDDDIMPVPNLAMHGPVTFGSAYVQPINIKGALTCMALAVAKVKVLKGPEQHWEVHKGANSDMKA